MLELYRRIWRLTGRAQVVLIVLSIVFAGLTAVHLHYQRDIINGLAEDMTKHGLLSLGAQFLGVLVLSGVVKFALDYRTSLLGEDVIRTIRRYVFRRHRESEGAQVERSDQGSTIVTMVTAEAEEIGRFAGGAIATPVMQIGTVLTIIAFIASTQAFLGLVVLAVVLPQAVIAFQVQKHINAKVAERVKVLRRTAKQIVAEDVEQHEQAVLADIDSILEARRKIFMFKLSTKLAINIITGLGTAGLLVLGGWLVLEGETDIGTVVADMTGLMRIAQPWRELIAFYRSLSTVRVKYELLEAALRG